MSIQDFLCHHTICVSEIKLHMYFYVCIYVWAISSLLMVKLGWLYVLQESTIGAAFFTEVLSIKDANVKLDIWDTAGQERYHSLAPMYYRGAAAAVVIYDITSKVLTSHFNLLVLPVWLNYTRECVLQWFDIPISFNTFAALLVKGIN